MSLSMRVAVAMACVVAIGAFHPSPARSQPAASGGYTSNASVSRTTVHPGVSIRVTAAVTSAKLSIVLVDVEVYSAAGSKVFQGYYDNQTLAAGARHTYPLTWAVPINQAPGPYSVAIGVFGPGWGALRHWNSAAAKFTVGSTAPSTTVTTSTTSTTVKPPSLPQLPGGWPRTLELGMSDSPGGSAAMRASAPFAFRYQYLAGGANTGNGWPTWNSDGQFVSSYVAESKAAAMTPVFTYYQLLQSAPGNGQGEPAGDFANLSNTATMTSYYQDLILFFQRAAATSMVVLHVEPDLWAYLQQRAHADNAATVPVQVASTGMPELAGLPDSAAGFAQAFVRLRDRFAPNVSLAYHFSTFGTGTDIFANRPAGATVDALGARTGHFYNSLGANFDIAFTDLADRDAGFKQVVGGDGGASWYTPADYGRSVRYIAAFVQTARKRAVIWQIPFGNTKMRAENNTWDHYQDNKVEWLLDDPTVAHLKAYIDAGVAAFLFGRGADGTTCACDANHDGVTNPAPVNGNNAVSLTADDDGGFFRQKADAFYNVQQTHPVALP